MIPAQAELTPRPKEMPAWDSLTADRRSCCRTRWKSTPPSWRKPIMRSAALLQAIQAEGKWIPRRALHRRRQRRQRGRRPGRRGCASGEWPAPDLRNASHDRDLGSEIFSNHYAAAWAWATNAPFQWAKQVASHLGGTRDPLIVSWPGHIKDAGACAASSIT